MLHSIIWNSFFAFITTAKYCKGRERGNNIHKGTQVEIAFFWEKNRTFLKKQESILQEYCVLSCNAVAKYHLIV